MKTLGFFSYAIMETLEFFSYVILKTLGFLRRLLVIYKKLLMEKLFFKGCNGIMCLSTTMEKGLTLVSADVGFKKMGKIKTDIIIPH